MRKISKLAFSGLSFLRKPLKGLYVLNSHDIGNAENWHTVERNLEVLSSKFNFVTLKSLGNYTDTSRPGLILTFDDGYKDWLRLGALLSEMSISAVFFVNSGLFKSSDVQAIQLRCKTTAVPLDLADLKILVSQGHVIGSHSCSHFELSSLDFNTFRGEIEEDVHFLENEIGKMIDCFAWPYGSYKSISEEQMAYLQTRFEFVFSSDNFTKRIGDTGIINRRHWELYMDTKILFGALKLIS